MGIFDEKTWVKQTSSPVPLLEISGATYHPGSDSYFLVSDARSIIEVNSNGDALRSAISLPTAIDDPEAIVWVDDDTFAILDEGDLPEIVKIHFVEITSTTTSVSAGDLTTHELPGIETFGGGLGAEAMAYDPVTDTYLIGVQNTAPNTGALWRVDLKPVAFGQEPTVERLWYFYDKLVMPGLIVAGDHISDFELARHVTGADGLFILTRGTSASRKVIEVDIDGNVLSYYDHALVGQIEGLAWNITRDEFIICGEPIGTNFWMYQAASVSLIDDSIDEPDDSVRLNHAGDSDRNPILSGWQFRLRIHRHSASEQLRKAWVTSGGEIVSVLTPNVVADGQSYYVDVEAGVDFPSGTEAVKSEIHVTTTHGETRAVVWCIDPPENEVLLDGINGDSAAEPVIWPIYTGA